MSNQYAERDADRFIFMQSDDGGLTWHAPGVVESISERDLDKVILLKSVPAVAWEPSP